MLAGCGGSSHTTSSVLSTSVPVTTSTVATPDPAPTGLAGRVLANNELPGFIGGQPTVDGSASPWLTDNQTPAGQMASEARRLNRLGFVAGAREDLRGSGEAGLSIVERFRSPAGARAELANELRTFKTANVGYTPFPVPGIPGALGLGGKAPPPGINVAFTSGDCYYLVGEEVPVMTAGAERSLVTAAQHLHSRLKP
jgi:hypothetical protein